MKEKLALLKIILATNCLNSIFDSIIYAHVVKAESWHIKLDPSISTNVSSVSYEHNSLTVGNKVYEGSQEIKGYVKDLITEIVIESNTLKYQNAREKQAKDCCYQNLSEALFLMFP